MLVLVADKFGRRQAKAIQALPSDQRSAVTVVAAFAAALVLLGVLFVTSGDTSSTRGGRPAANLMAQDSPVQPAPVDPAPSNA
jgi:hypothetical protein